MKTKILIQCVVLAFILCRLLAVGPAMAEDKPALSFKLGGATNQPTAIVFAKDLKWLGTHYDSGEVEVWDVAKGARVAQWQSASVAGDPLLIDREQAPMAFLPDSTQLFVATGTNVTIRESVTGKIIRTLESPPNEVTKITISPGGNRGVGLTGAGRQLELVFWNLSNGKIMSQLPTKRDPREMGLLQQSRNNPRMGGRLPASIIAGLCRAFSQDGERFAVGLQYAQIELWNLESGEYVDTLEPSSYYAMNSSGRITSLAFLAEQKLVAVVNNGELSAGAMRTNRTNGAAVAMTTLIRGGTGFEIRSLAVSGDGKRFAVAGMRMGKREGFLQPAGTFVFDVPMHGEVQVWDAVAMKLLATFKGEPSEKFFLVALDDSGLRVAAVTTGVAYNPRMLGAMQQSAELMGGTNPLRVCVWDLPAHN